MNRVIFILTINIFKVFLILTKVSEPAKSQKLPPISYEVQSNFGAKLPSGIKNYNNLNCIQTKKFVEQYSPSQHISIQYSQNLKNNGMCQYSSQTSTRPQPSCCNSEIENLIADKKLETLEQNTQDIISGLHIELEKTAQNFKNVLIHSLKTSGLNLNNVFNRTYGMLYARNSDLFLNLFRHLTLKPHEQEPERALTNFFQDLYARTFELLNVQYNVASDTPYGNCVKSTYNEFRPFASINKQGLATNVQQHLKPGANVRQKRQTNNEKFLDTLNSFSRQNRVPLSQNNPQIFSQHNQHSYHQQQSNGKLQHSKRQSMRRMGNTVKNQNKFVNSQQKEPNMLNAKRVEDPAHEIITKLSRALNSAKACINALTRISNLISIEKNNQHAHNNGLSWVKQMFRSDQSIRTSIMKLWGCSICQPSNISTNILPEVCSPFCRDIIGHSMQSFKELDSPWTRLISELMTLVKRLQSTLNLNDIIGTLDVKISEAIMNFQENAMIFSSQIFKKCGQPTLKAYSSSMFSGVSSIEDWKRFEQQFPPTNSTTNNINLDDSLIQIQDLLENAQHFWVEMKDSLVLELCPMFFHSKSPKAAKKAQQLKNKKQQRNYALKEKTSIAPDNTENVCWNGFEYQPKNLNLSTISQTYLTSLSSHQALMSGSNMVKQNLLNTMKYIMLDTADLLQKSHQNIFIPIPTTDKPPESAVLPIKKPLKIVDDEDSVLGSGSGMIPFNIHSSKVVLPSIKTVHDTDRKNNDRISPNITLGKSKAQLPKIISYGETIKKPGKNVVALPDEESPSSKNNVEHIDEAIEGSGMGQDFSSQTTKKTATSNTFLTKSNKEIQFPGMISPRLIPKRPYEDVTVPNNSVRTHKDSVYVNHKNGKIPPDDIIDNRISNYLLGDGPAGEKTVKRAANAKTAPLIYRFAYTVFMLGVALVP